MEKPLVFVDLDFTLTHFDEAAACRALLRNHGARVEEVLRTSFEKLIRVYSGVAPHAEVQAVEALRAFLYRTVRAHGSTPSDIVWSREGALEYYLTAELAPGEIMSIADTYWKTIGENGRFYPDARKFLRDVQKTGNPLFVVTASDGRLLYDYHESTWCYYPELSAKMKKWRIGFGELYQELEEERVLIAEPCPKSEVEFWRRLQGALGAFGPHVWMIGDSYASDLVALKTFAPEVNTVLLDRDGKVSDRTAHPLADHVVRDLSEATALILAD